MLERRSEVIRFQESPASVLRKSPPRDASQISPVALIASALMTNSGSSGLVAGSQLSPPFTETVMALRLAMATILPETLMLVGAATPGRTSFCHEAPESVLTKNPVAVAANQ